MRRAKDPAVYVNGLRQIKHFDYTVTKRNKIKFKYRLKRKDIYAVSWHLSKPFLIEFFCYKGERIK